MKTARAFVAASAFSAVFVTALFGAGCSSSSSSGSSSSGTIHLGGIIADALFPPNGKDGKVSFVYRTSPVCGRGCAYGPMLVGSVEVITLGSNQIEIPAGLRASSSAADVAGVVVVPSPAPEADAGAFASMALEVKGLTVGQTELRIMDESGATLDRIDLVVHEASSISMSHSEPKAGTSTVDSVKVAAGSGFIVSYLARDKDKAILQASSGWKFASSALNVAIPEQCNAECRADDEAKTFASTLPKLTLHGLAAGTTTFTLSAGAQSVSVPVTVTP